MRIDTLSESDEESVLEIYHASGGRQRQKKKRGSASIGADIGCLVRLSQSLVDLEEAGGVRDRIPMSSKGGELLFRRRSWRRKPSDSRILHAACGLVW